MNIFSTLQDRQGFEPIPPELNSDLGVLEITGPPHFELLEDRKTTIETLVLRCTLKPLPLLNKNIKVQLTVEGIPLPDCQLYEKDSMTYGYAGEIESSCWEGITLQYDGLGYFMTEGNSTPLQGDVFSEGRLLMGNPLYVKPFITESEQVHERVTSYGIDQILVTPPGKLNTRVLRGYGGYYKEGAKLDDICQVYYSLVASEDRTRVRLFSSLLLHEQHTPPPLGGQDFKQNLIYFPEPKREQYLSLGGALAEGFCTLSLETNAGISLFRSYLGERLVGHPSKVFVHFKPYDP
jgi:hypothetical protein